VVATRGEVRSEEGGRDEEIRVHYMHIQQSSTLPETTSCALASINMVDTTPYKGAKKVFDNGEIGAGEREEGRI
jgi:hypothetical protein